ncbi:hypothetical protein PRZ48_012038, partial [Zasmidium cellare]
QFAEDTIMDENVKHWQSAIDSKIKKRKALAEEARRLKQERLTEAKRLKELEEEWERVKQPLPEELESLEFQQRVSKGLDVMEALVRSCLNDTNEH